MTKRIPRAVREQAADALAMSASSSGAMSLYDAADTVADSHAERRAILDLMVAAEQAAILWRNTSPRPHCTCSGCEVHRSEQEARWREPLAEAEALLRTGWTP